MIEVTARLDVSLLDAFAHIWLGEGVSSVRSRSLSVFLRYLRCLRDRRPKKIIEMTSAVLEHGFWLSVTN